MCSLSIYSFLFSAARVLSDRGQSTIECETLDLESLVKSNIIRGPCSSWARCRHGNLKGQSLLPHKGPRLQYEVRWGGVIPQHIFIVSGVFTAHVLHCNSTRCIMVRTKQLRRLKKQLLQKHMIVMEHFFVLPWRRQQLTAVGVSIALLRSKAKLANRRKWHVFKLGVTLDGVCTTADEIVPFYGLLAVILTSPNIILYDTSIFLEWSGCT